MVAHAIDTIRRLFELHGSQHYGEDVSQLDHAVQAATLARECGLADELVLAAFLHDIGHLLEHDGGATMGGYGIMAHDQLGADYLRSLGFSAQLARLVEQHVPAKRYLCAARPDYFVRLSEASRITLHYQGGPMSVAEAAAFAAQEDLEAILTVRRLDDEAKDSGWTLADVDWIWEKMARHLAQAGLSASPRPSA